MKTAASYATLAVDQCPACGAPDALVALQDATLPLYSGTLTSQVPHLSGQRCRYCDECQLEPDSQRRYLAAADELSGEARREAGAQLRRVRLKLRLSQQEAAAIAGGGPNAFSRYETGKAQPVAAVFNLFHLLDRHPDLLAELTGVPQKHPQSRLKGEGRRQSVAPTQR
ncbi:type II TA system antitoxin MqsA family protein [Stenotrophomonas rhizophila]|jgi:HTH-type transcriptional regulator/antitoxin MqsA|uniref:type II TA system antitoxin MqsA family protein n=1 Tax=Stenotrophomonas rhizophila TaxID=216778 RepID=UPI0010C06997|nr:type II TA system antitoxin MqsA family protein [Stenotrophomonas rhizophila]TKK07568.1 XRE family transcriptional regulator [Stenotrophomonas rhizophila]